MRFLALALMLLAAPLTAQEQEVQADLDGDGVQERYGIIQHQGGGMDLIVEVGDTRTRYHRVVWAGGLPGTQPWLELAQNGSVQVISGNEGFGRNRWHQVLTLAHRGGALRVAGFTYDWYDTLDLDAGGFCDINLLTGQGVLRQADGPERRFRETELTALPLTEWTEDIFPVSCHDAMPGAG